MLDPMDEAHLGRTPGRTGAIQHLQQLPQLARAAVVLASCEGVTYRDVARRLGISESAAKAQIRTGLRVLKELADGVAGAQPPPTISRARS